MGARDLLSSLAGAGLSVTAEAGRLVIWPASKLTDDMREALRAAKPQLLALPAEDQAQVDQSDGQAAVSTRARTCAGCAHLTRRQTCTEPAAAGLDPPPGHRPGADWFGIRWPPDGYGDTCASYRDEPAPAAQECLYGPSAANADT